MFYNYILTAWRTLIRRRAYAFLNLFGLTIGIASCLIILQYVSYERSYDDFHKDADRIVRVRLDAYRSNELLWQSATSFPAIGPAIHNDFPEAEDHCRLIDATLVLSNDERHVSFSEKKGYFADASVFSFFHLPLISGSAKSFLEVNTILLSESTAQRYFGDEEAVGKTLVARDHGNQLVYRVAGVFSDLPANSHLLIDYLVSYSTLDYDAAQNGDTTRPAETSWGWYDFYTYVKLKPGVDLNSFQSKMPGFCNRHINNRPEYKKSAFTSVISLIPLRDIHLYSHYNQEAEINGDGQTVSVLFLVGFIILIIAWINYINLTTSYAMERARELAMRKIFGAWRREIILRFMAESLLLNLFSFVMAMTIVELVSPSFNNMMGLAGTGKVFISGKYFLLFFIAFVSGVVLSGAYPGLVMSGHHPLRLLRGVFGRLPGSRILRKSLIVFQFTVAVMLISGTIIVWKQVRFMREHPVGASIGGTLVLEGANSNNDSLYAQSFNAFAETVKKQERFKNLTVSSSVPGQEIYWTSGIRKLGGANEKALTMYHLGVDENFVPVFEIPLASGRNFSKEFGTDDKNCLLNETGARQLGFANAEQCLGKKVSRGRRDTFTVVGVVKDFHQQGVQKAIDPMIILYRPDLRQNYSIRLGSDSYASAVSDLEKIWKQFFPNDPYNYFVLDDLYHKQYKPEESFGQMFGLFALIAILVACFGLIGLTAYNVVQRRKEIGIRKIIGASVAAIVRLLTSEFTWLILLAFVIAVPLTWYLMDRWLMNFAFRISIEWWIFLIADILAIIISIGTIIIQSVRAALVNPVMNLRTE